MHNIGQQIVVLQPIVNGHLLEIDGQCPGLDAAFIFLSWMCPELLGEYVEYLFANPASLCEGCEREVIWIDFSQTYADR